MWVTVDVVVPCVTGHTPSVYMPVRMEKKEGIVYHAALRTYQNSNPYHCQVLICEIQKTCKIQIYGNLTFA